MSEKDGFPSAYSSFAVSVDSRNAERPIYSTPPLESSNGILRHTRPGHEKRRSLSPMSSDRLDRVSAKPSVRFTRDTIHEYGHHNEQQPMHHRRSSTAAFLEYIRTHLPESQRRGSISLTPKRGLALFAIVFSATYLALALLPMLANVVGFGGPVTVVIRRGDGYYGNSHIFRGGENLADPHLAGDEHHQYLAHAANVAATGSGIREAHEPNARPKQRNLKTSTLAEEATLQELRVARAKAKAEALARAEQLRQQERDGIEQAAEGSAEEPSSQVKGESARRRPLMPLKKLADKVKSDREARKKAMAEKEAFEAEIEKEAFQVASIQPDEKDAPMERAHSANLVDEDDTDLEGIIAKLRQEALDRRLRKIHAAQRDNKASHQGDDLRKKAVFRDVVNDEARIRRPGIVKSRKVSTQDE